MIAVRRPTEPHSHLERSGLGFRRHSHVIASDVHSHDDLALRPWRFQQSRWRLAPGALIYVLIAVWAALVFTAATLYAAWMLLLITRAVPFNISTAFESVPH